MSVYLDSFGIDQMSFEDRLTLVEAIWDSIVTAADRLPLSAAFRAELDQRLEDHRADPDDVVPWEEANAAALDRMSPKNADS